MSSKVLVCNKGNMDLFSQIDENNNKTTYELSFSLKSLNPDKINIENLLSYNIYTLLEKINTDLIEKITLLNIYDDNTVDILILLKHIAKEVGLKQKYILFRSQKKIDYENDIIIFENKDISLLDSELANKYICSNKLNMKNIEPLIYNYGSTIIKININLQELSQNIVNKNNDMIIDAEFIIKYQILIKDELPIYMKHTIGLMMKKIFYNLKQFIENLNN
tara:strand:- start:1670 stop:2332 length:663 start_codon:yes stop_codon:yes gene_type:complete